MTEVTELDDRRLFRGGILWNYAGSGAVILAQIMYTAATARLILPAGFGAYAAAQVLVSLVGYFTLTSLGNAVLRSDAGKSIVGTALWIAGIAGLASASVLVLLAPTWGRLWESRETIGLLYVLSLLVLCSALSAVPIALVRKSLKYRTGALLESASQIGGMLVGVLLAVEWRSATALAAGQAVGAALLMVGAFYAARADIARSFSRDAARPLLSFAGQVSGQNLVYYVIYSVPTYAIARLFGVVTLGLYSRVNLLVTLPLNHVNVGITKALYPIVVLRRADRPATARLIESTLLTTTSLFWPCFAFLAGSASVVVPVLLGERWTAAEELLPPVALFGAVNVAFVALGNPLEALGYLRAAWGIQLGWLVLLLLGLAWAWQRDASLVQILFMVALLQAAAHVAQVVVVSRLGYIDAVRVMKRHVTNLAVSLVLFLAVAGVANLTAGRVALSGRALIQIGAVAILGALLAAQYRVWPRAFGGSGGGAGA